VQPLMRYISIKTLGKVLKISKSVSTMYKHDQGRPNEHCDPKMGQ